MTTTEWDDAGKWTSAAQAFLLLAFFFAAVAVGADFRPPFRPPPDAIPVYDFSPPDAPQPFRSPPPKKAAAKINPPADVALDKTREENRAREEEQKRADAAERERKDAEVRLAEQRRREEEEKQRLAEQKQLEEERIRERRREEEQKRAAAAAERARILANVRDSYAARIKKRIDDFLITPLAAKGIDNLEVVVEFNLAADGSLADLPTIAKSSGVAAYDEAARRAVLNASPLPMPKEPELLPLFRHLRLSITPE